MHCPHNLNFINVKLLQSFKIRDNSKINLRHSVLPQKNGGNQTSQPAGIIFGFSGGGRRANEGGISKMFNIRGILAGNQLING